MENSVKQGKPTYYDIDRIFTAKSKNKNLVVIEYDTQDGKVYYSVLDYFEVDTHKIFDWEIQIIEPFKDVLLKNDLGTLLIDQNGNMKNSLSTMDIVLMMKHIKAKLIRTPIQLDYIKTTSVKAVNVICDLLGLNINSNPSSKLNLGVERPIHEVVVPATKLDLFKQTLIQYFNTFLLNEKSIVSSNCKDFRDYRIARSLKVAKIKVTDELKQNSFSITVDLEGNLMVDGVNIIKRSEGFQKIIDKF